MSKNPSSGPFRPVSNSPYAKFIYNQTLWLQAVPPPPRPAGRITSFHNLQQDTTPVSVHRTSIINYWMWFYQEDPQPSPSEESESKSLSDYDEEAFDLQQEDLQLPPELMLQQAFTKRSAFVNIGQINADVSKKNGVSLHTVNHNEWKVIAEVEFPDLPLWFDYQVCIFLLLLWTTCAIKVTLHIYLQEARLALP